MGFSEFVGELKIKNQDRSNGFVGRSFLLQFIIILACAVHHVVVADNFEHSKEEFLFACSILRQKSLWFFFFDKEKHTFIQRTEVAVFTFW